MRSKKRCPRCTRTMACKYFSKHRATKDGFACYCKRCAAERQSLIREKYPNYNRISGWLHQGILLEYIPLALKIKARGLCELCGASEYEFRRALSVDHCHQSGRPRGLLCSTCNSHIGWYERNKKIIKAYLTK